jgi:hypothetical protein
VHVAALRGIPLVLKRFGIPHEPILESVNLRLEDLDDPDRSAPFAELDRLIGLCQRKTKCGHFGLLVGQTINLQSFGVAGRLARNAPSVGASLQELAAYSRCTIAVERCAWRSTMAVSRSATASTCRALRTPTRSTTWRSPRSRT